VLGRLAVAAANLLRGKHKPTFTPNTDGGDFVIIVNAEKVALSGDKQHKKLAFRHSGYPGGLKSRTIGELLDKHPDRVVEKAIVGMIPKKQARPPDQAQAARLRRSAASARCSAADSVRDQAGGPMTETAGTETAGTETALPETEVRGRRNRR